MNEQIDIDALEQYVLENRETLCSENIDEKFEIDITNMKPQPKPVAQTEDATNTPTPSAKNTAQIAQASSTTTAKLPQESAANDEYFEALKQV